MGRKPSLSFKVGPSPLFEIFPEPPIDWDQFDLAMKCRCVFEADQASLHRSPIDCKDEAYWRLMEARLAELLWDRKALLERYAELVEDEE